MKLKISARVKEKLRKKHNVGVDEVIECFANREGGIYKDVREDHKTNPPSLWFIAETNMGLHLKVVYINKNGEIHIKTAYPANKTEKNLYNRLAGLD
ncbi:MAG: ADP-ribosyl-(dinitrogen reductase) hydrolase [Proteobacteria bacterium]|nr:MAG: ADP-ribosyl-(dinitrogen reductase) hydrolase [Pseudomonadota bacterium]